MSKNNKNLFNQKELNSFRSSLRKRSTPAEAALWEMLKFKKLDGRRDKYLESLGFIVLRFENRFVFQEPEYIKSEIRKVLMKEMNRPDRQINHPGREINLVNVR